jgi:GNAT superfamily N-acetyltransferase
MNTSDFTGITRIAQGQWHALEDDQVVGRAHASHRPDGRLFISSDAWHDTVFDRLAGAMLADLPRPLYTVVDEADADLRLNWVRAGFTTRRREWELLVPTVAGVGSGQPPAGVTILPVGAAEEGPLRILDRVIRDEVEATVGWQEMPAEVLPRLDPSKYAVAARPDRYVGLLRLAALPRQPRIGLVAVRSDQRRRGVARALLAQTLASLHERGIPTVAADVNESNGPAMALFDGLGARRVSSNLELVLR